MRILVYADLDEGGALRALRGFLPFLESRHEVLVARPASAAPIRTEGAGEGRGLAPSPREILLPAGSLAFSPKSPAYMLHKLTDPLAHALLEREEARWARRLDESRHDLLLVHSARGRGAPALLAHARLPTAYYCTEPLRLFREPRVEGAAPAAAVALGRGLIAPAALWWNARDRAHALRATRILANSEHTAALVARLFGREARVVRPGIDLDRFGGGASPAARAAERDGVWLVPGAFVPQKGQAFVLRAAARIPPSQRRPLVLAGYAGLPSYRRRLARLAERLGVAAAFHADPDDAAMAALFARAEMALIGAVREPLGLVSLEAQAAGTPVVVVREGGLPETVRDGVTGLLAPREEEAFAEAVVRLATDRARRESMGDAAREWVAREFSLEAAGKRLLAALEAIVPGAARPRAAPPVPHRRAPVAGREGRK